MNYLGHFSASLGGAAVVILTTVLPGCATQEAVPAPAQLDASAGISNTPVQEALTTEVSEGVDADVFVEPEPEVVPGPAIVPPPVEYDRGDVVWIQERLQDLGYYDGAADGSAGKATRKAIRAYQNDQGIDADGRPTAELRQFMWRNGG